MRLRMVLLSLLAITIGFCYLTSVSLIFVLPAAVMVLMLVGISIQMVPYYLRDESEVIEAHIDEEWCQMSANNIIVELFPKGKDFVRKSSDDDIEKVIGERLSEMPYHLKKAIIACVREKDRAMHT